MAAAGVIHFLVADPADVTTPSANHIAYFANSLDGNKPYWKDDAGVIHSLLGGTGAQGPIGPVGFDGEEIESDIILIPGQKGDKGDTGATGATGPIVASGAHLLVDEGGGDSDFIPIPGNNSGGSVSSDTLTKSHTALAFLYTGQSY